MKRKKLNNAERQKIYDKYKGHCAYCGCELEYRDMQVDHVFPLRRGGSDDVDNMLPACRSCNHYKATLTADEYKEYVSRIPERLHRDSIPYQVGERFGIIQSNRDVQFYFEKFVPERSERGMTPEEAIKTAIHCLGVQAEHEVCEECPVYLDGGIACREAARVAIEALKEVQQYREIGTVEQVRNQKHNLEMAYKIISDYEAIGTVKECREAVEKHDKTTN